MAELTVTLGSLFPACSRVKLVAVMKAVAVNVPVSAQKTALLHTGIVLYAPLIKEQNFHIMVLFHDSLMHKHGYRQTDRQTNGPSTLQHLSLSRPNFAIPSNKGVNDFAFFVGTRVEKETN